MSEVLTEVPDTKEAGYQPGEHVSPSAESVESRLAELDRVLTPLVSANAEVIVRCPWLGNAEVTLSEAMKAYPRPMIEEDPYSLAGIVKELLANPVTTEEQRDSNPEEVENETEQQETDDNKGNGEPEKRAYLSSDIRPKKTTENKSRAQPAGPKTPVVSQLKIKETSYDPSDSTLEITPEPLTDKPAAVETHKEAGYTQTSKTSAGLSTRGRAETPGFTNHVAENLEPEPVAEEDLIPPETAESMEPLSSGTESINDEIEIYDVEREFEPEYQFIDDIPINLVEEEVLPHETLEIGLEPEEHGFEIVSDLEDGPDMEKDEQPDKGLHQPQKIEAFDAEHLDSTEETEDMLTRLSEYIEQASLQTAAAANVFLDRINEISAELEIDEIGNLISEAEIREELAELFAGLFDSLGSKYNPSLIERLVHLTINEYLTAGTEELSDEEGEEKPQDSGTHEAIKKLLAGSNTVRRAMSQAPVIGKSALTLYSNRVLVEEYLTR